MIKGSIHQERITILRVYVHNRARKYIKQELIEMQGEIEKSSQRLQYLSLNN